jgi:hypothetical protein
MSADAISAEVTVVAAVAVAVVPNDAIVVVV